MGTKLYVGSLPFETTEDEVHQYFTQFGKVTSTKLIKDKFTGQSRGFAFVEMGSDEEAKVAIEKAHGQPMGSRQLTVNEARPMEERPAGGKGGFGGGRGGSFGGGRGGFGGGSGGGRGGFRR